MNHEQSLLQALHVDPCDDTAWLALGQVDPAKGELAELTRSEQPPPQEGQERQEGDRNLRFC